MELVDLIEQVSGFDASPPKEKIKLFAWWLHTHVSKELFGPAEIRSCFDKIHIDEPAAVATYLSRMVDSKDLLKEKGQYKLGRSARAELDKKYGVHHSVVAINKILTDLSAQVPNIAQREFLQEALKCYRVEAYRACIVMAWNIAYAHLLDWILKDQVRLDKFNATISRRYQNLKTLQISKYDDFGDNLQERQVLEIANTANLYNSGIFKVLKDKLDRRNNAAHPSNVIFVQSQADDMITDLVHNVVLALV
jgi:hypothetical protein